MNQYQFLKQLNNTPSPGGDGVRVTKYLGPQNLATAAGLTLTGATVPAIVVSETNAIVVSVVAGQTAGGSFTFQVPKDYDKLVDELKLNVICRSSGNTDTPTLTATAYRKRAGAALTAALTVVASAAIPNSTANAAERTVVLSGNSLLPGDILQINLVTAAHATDAVQLYGVETQYRSSIVFADPTTR